MAEREHPDDGMPGRESARSASAGGDGGDRPVPASGYNALHEVAQNVLSLFLERVGDAMARTGVTTVDPDALDAIAARFSQDKDTDLQAILAEGWEHLEEAFESAFWARMRKYPLERLIVSRFEDKLPPRGEPPVPGRTLSRRIIPALHAALQQMLGPDQLADYEGRAHALVEALRRSEGAGNEWRALYGHPHADILVTDILVYIARYFTDVPKRRDWLVAFMDRNMAAPHSDAERAWRFGDREFHMLLAALYRPLGEALAAPEQRERLVMRYGEANVALVEHVLDALAADRRALPPEE